MATDDEEQPPNIRGNKRTASIDPKGITPRNIDGSRDDSETSGRSNRPSAFFDWPDEKDMPESPEGHNESSPLHALHHTSLGEATPSVGNYKDTGWNYKPPTLLDDADVFPMTSSILNQRTRIPRVAQTLLSNAMTVSTSRYVSQTRRILRHESDRNKENVAKEQRKSSGNPTHLYGLPIPNAPSNICAACSTMGEPDEVILLCDGENCGREYHLKCCIPPMQEVPEGQFFCIDCHPKGATASLEQYFEAHEEHKLEWMKKQVNHDHEDIDDGFLLGSEYAEHRLVEDVTAFERYQQDTGGNQGDTQTIAGKKKKTVRVPVSELLHFHREDDRAKNFVGKSIRLYCPIGDEYHNGRILDARKPTAVTYDTEDGTGNKVKGDKAKSSRRHTKARFAAKTSFLDIDDTEILVRFPAGKDNRKTSLTLWMRLEEHCVALATQIAWGRLKGNCLVKEVKAMNQLSNFSIDTMKTGSNSPKKKSRKRKFSSDTSPLMTDLWVPIRVWQRTAPEVVPVSHLLKEEKGEIQFHEFKVGRNGRKIGSSTGARKPKLKPTSYALGQSIRGEENYQLMNLESDVAKTPPPPFNALVVADRGPSTPATELPLDLMRQLQLLVSLARTELYEQDQVRKWRNLPLSNPVHPLALTSRDEEALGSLDFLPTQHLQEASLVDDYKMGVGKRGGGLGEGNDINFKRSKNGVSLEENDVEEIELCPLIRHGLDRAYILNAMSSRIGVERSKDVGSSLVCELLMDSVSTAAQCVTEQHKKWLQNQLEDEQLDHTSAAVVDNNEVVTAE